MCIHSLRRDLKIENEKIGGPLRLAHSSDIRPSFPQPPIVRIRHSTILAHMSHGRILVTDAVDCPPFVKLGLHSGFAFRALAWVIGLNYPIFCPDLYDTFFSSWQRGDINIITQLLSVASSLLWINEALCGSLLYCLVISVVTEFSRFSFGVFSLKLCTFFSVWRRTKTLVLVSVTWESVWRMWRKHCLIHWVRFHLRRLSMRRHLVNLPLTTLSTILMRLTWNYLMVCYQFFYYIRQFLDRLFTISSYFLT